MLKKIPNQTVASIIVRYQTSEQAKALLKTSMTPNEAIETLLQEKLYRDTVQLIAHALPMIEAISWATETLCCRVDEWNDKQIQAMNSVRNWLKSPTETNRIRANQLAERLGLESAPAWTAKAVYWSGTGSIVPVDLPEVLPPAFLYGQAVATAITIAAAVPPWPEESKGYEQYYLDAIRLGLAIAQGKPLEIDTIVLKEEG